MGTSRRNLLQEELGYIDGGSETLVTALVDAIMRHGGEIRMGEQCRKSCPRTANNRCATAKGAFRADHVICTVPTPYVSRLAPSLPDDWKKRYDAIPNIGVVCVMVRLRRSVTPHFWVNISDERIDIPGIIEFSNLRPLPDTVVYVPYYMPQNHPKFAKDDAFFADEVLRYLQIINPTLTKEDVVAINVGRLRYAQPVCAPRFLETLPDVVTPIEGLQIADTCTIIPRTAGSPRAARLAKVMAGRID